MTRTSVPVRAVKSVEANRQVRREQILDMAAELFASGGYQATTMDQLSEKTGLNKGTLYYYYEAKADILFDICSSVLTAVIDALRQVQHDNPLEALNETIRTSLLLFREKRARATCYLQEESVLPNIFSPEQLAEINEMVGQGIEMLQFIFQRGNELGYFRITDMPLTASIVGRCLSSSVQWVDVEIDYLIRYTQNLIVHGLRG